MQTLGNVPVEIINCQELSEITSWGLVIDGMTLRELGCEEWERF
jgi:hypothetical protein